MEGRPPRGSEDQTGRRSLTEHPSRTLGTRSNSIRDPSETYSPRSRNSCFTCFRCFFVSPGNTSCTSDDGGTISFEVILLAAPSVEIDTPDVDRSMRFCSAICCWSQPTSSCLDTVRPSHHQRCKIEISGFNLRSYSVPLRMLLTLNAACSRRPLDRGRGYTVNKIPSLTQISL